MSRNPVTTVKNSIVPYVAMEFIETIVLRMSVENMTPMLPIANIVTNKKRKIFTKSIGEIPPNKKTKL